MFYLNRQNITFILQVFVVFLFLMINTNCESKPKTETVSSSTQSATTRVISAERGKMIYSTQCTACHNTDPHKAGALGPEVFGSSKDLLEARILRAAYPEGYTPKRTTHTMAPLPHLKDEIDSIHAYLNAN